MRESANATRRVVAKPLAICAYCSKSAFKREKAFRVYATVRVCEKAQKTFASAFRRPVTYAHIVRTLRDPAVLPGQSDATWSKRISSRLKSFLRKGRRQGQNQEKKIG